MTTPGSSLAAVLLALSAAAPAWAHHSRAEFADETSEIRGELVNVIWRNPHVAEQPASPLGFSMGRWDGNTLTVTTTRIDWLYFDGQGTPQSPAVEVTERFTLSNDQTELAFHMTVVDPVTFDGIATREWHYLALGEPFFVVECNVF